MRYPITDESEGETILKIGQHFAEVLGWNGSGCFYLNTASIFPIDAMRLI